MRIAFGADHAGFELKELLARRAAELGHEVLDLGTSSTVSVDYPDFGFAVGRAVASGPGGARRRRLRHAESASRSPPTASPARGRAWRPTSSPRS